MTHQVEVRKQSFSKIFRWQAPNGHIPSKVEVAGTFSHWKKLPLTREISGGWNLTLHQIPGNRTHHFMFFADDQPVSGHSDGLAIPQGSVEEQFALTTARGPRVFMLFSQTK
ncbi:MAG TPA: glycogen-binding domain-containing protein [Candidatus Acidoferrales bacterium]|nr:glycogen-binding domain-containing protein [Candidatus Acidoferrales bacterium]